MPVGSASSFVRLGAAETMVTEFAHLRVGWDNIGYHNIIADMATGARELLTR